MRYRGDPNDRAAVQEYVRRSKAIEDRCWRIAEWNMRAACGLIAVSVLVMLIKLLA